MNFSPQLASEIQAYTQQHVTQKGFPFEVTSSVSADNSIDVTLRDPQAQPSRGVVLRLTEEFLRFSDPQRVREVMDQQADYFSKQGLKPMEDNGFPVIVIGST